MGTARIEVHVRKRREFALENELHHQFIVLMATTEAVFQAEARWLEFEVIRGHSVWTTLSLVG
jgi:hypothetical protein